MRNFPPGTHGPTQGPAKNLKMTDFGKQMREKQRAKAMYAILEKQFRAYVDKAIAVHGDSSVILHALLELRLDNVVFRAGFAPSRASARQLVAHGLIRVNGKKVDIASYQTDVDEVISIAPEALSVDALATISARMGKIQVPSWISMSPEKQSITITSQPASGDVEQTFNAGTVLEFYSR